MPSSPARRALSLGAALLALLAVVALAARGHVVGGGGPTRRLPTDLVFEYVLLLLGVLVLIALPVIAFGLQQVRRDPELLPKRRNWMVRVFGTMTIFAVALMGWLIYRWVHGHHGHGIKLNPQLFHPGSPNQRSARPPRPVAFDWAPVIVVLSVVVVAALIGAAYILRVRRASPPREARAALALSDALDESLDDLRREGDPRRAVIAAYARMERALAASGLPRRAAEAPLEYLGRVLRDLLRASAASVSRLTDLFERAKFSHHEVGPEMKEEAIAALVAVRDELRAYS